MKPLPVPLGTYNMSRCGGGYVKPESRVSASGGWTDTAPVTGLGFTADWTLGVRASQEDRVFIGILKRVFKKKMIYQETGESSRLWFHVKSPLACQPCWTRLAVPKRAK